MEWAEILDRKPCAYSVLTKKRTAAANENGPEHHRYTFDWPHAWTDYLCDAFDELNEYRKRCIREQDEWRAQKRVLGRYAKDEERLWLRRERASKLILGWLFAPDIGGCEFQEPYYWPEDLHADVMHVAMQVMR